MRVGDDSQEEDDVEYETEDLGEKGGKGARAPVAVPATGRGYSFAPVKPLVTMPGHQVAQGYREVPGTVDAQGISQGPACLRCLLTIQLLRAAGSTRHAAARCAAQLPSKQSTSPVVYARWCLL